MTCEVFSRLTALALAAGFFVALGSPARAQKPPAPPIWPTQEGAQQADAPADKAETADTPADKPETAENDPDMKDIDPSKLAGACSVPMPPPRQISRRRPRRNGRMMAAA